MGKVEWRPGNMLYPLPVVMVSVADKTGNKNIITVAWAGTICTNPPMLSISVRPERYSYEMIRESGEFVVNLTTEDLAYATDYCGVKSGRDVDKFNALKLTPLKGTYVDAPLIGESPVNLECKVKEVIELGSHHMFVAQVVATHVDDRFLDKQGKFHLENAKPIVYSHGTYFGCGRELGTFGYSIKNSEKNEYELDKKVGSDKKASRGTEKVSNGKKVSGGIEKASNGKKVSTSTKKAGKDRGTRQKSHKINKKN